MASARPEALVAADARMVLAGQLKVLEPLRGTTLFITGGTGFLGAWILELVKVLNTDHAFNLKVTSLSRGAREFAARWPHLGGQSWLRLQEGDVRHLSDVPRETQFIVHAAAITDRRQCASRPSAVAEVNVLGALRLLRAANLLEDLRRVVHLSSALVAGPQPWSLATMPEDFVAASRCDDVTTVYAESKRMAEMVMQCAVSEWKAPVVMLRPFAFIGPYQNLQLPWAVTDFVRDCLNGGPLRIMGDGSTVRSLLYAADAALWILAAAASGRDRSTYNIGSSEPVALSDLARQVASRVTPAPAVLLGVGQSGHERTRLVPAVDRIRADLGVRPVFTLEQAIDRSIAWHRLAGSA